MSRRARATGTYPIFGTHDPELINAISGLADERGWRKDAFEFEFLYGVKTRLQETLVDDGYCVRAYVPFGRDWWPYVARRIGERPENLRFVLGSLVGS